MVKANYENGCLDDLLLPELLDTFLKSAQEKPNVFNGFCYVLQVIIYECGFTSYANRDFDEAISSFSDTDFSFIRNAKVAPVTFSESCSSWKFVAFLGGIAALKFNFTLTPASNENASNENASNENASNEKASNENASNIIVSVAYDKDAFRRTFSETFDCSSYVSIQEKTYNYSNLCDLSKKIKQTLLRPIKRHVSMIYTRRYIAVSRRDPLGPSSRKTHDIIKLFDFEVSETILLQEGEGTVLPLITRKLLHLSNHESLSTHYAFACAAQTFFIECGYKWNISQDNNDQNVSDLAPINQDYGYKSLLYLKVHNDMNFCYKCHIMYQFNRCSPALVLTAHCPEIEKACFSEVFLVTKYVKIDDSAKKFSFCALRELSHACKDKVINPLKAHVLSKMQLANNSIYGLPADIFLKLAKWLDVKTFLNLISVNQSLSQWRNCEDIWEAFFKRDFATVYEVMSRENKFEASWKEKYITQARFQVTSRPTMRFIPAHPNVMWMFN